MAQNNKSNYLHTNTPLLESPKLSKLIGAKVYVKLDALQPTGSFKIRGIGHLAVKAVTENKCEHLVTSSGGNAGLAVAYSGRKLNVPVTVVVPETTPEFMRTLIQEEGAKVHVHGKAWDDANELAKKITAEVPNSFLVHPFDDKSVWEGHATLISEVAAEGVKPTVVITVVGGGGLLVGICEGLHKQGWTDVPIIASETEGAASFAAAVKKGELVTLDGITSVAKTLGAKRVCQEALDWTKKHKIISHLVTDKMAVKACVRFASDHRVMVEPSCGAGLAIVYEKLPVLMDILATQKDPVVLLEVCGGNMVNLDTLKEWEQW